KRDFVDRDRDLHPRTELRPEGIGVVRFRDGLCDRFLRMLQRFERLRRIDDGAPGRELLESEVLSVVEQDGRCPAIDFEDESRTATSGQDRTPPSLSRGC